MAKRRKPKKLEIKYKLRRFFLFLLFIAVFAGCSWYILKGDKAQEVNAAPETNVSQEEASTVGQFPDITSISEPEAGEESAQTEPEPQTQEDWQLILVNSSHLIPEDHAPKLTHLTGSVLLDERIVGDLIRMTAHAKANGIELRICSAYRSIEYQGELFNNKMSEYLAAGQDEQDAIAAAALTVAKPGASEYHTGLAVDIASPEYPDLDEGFADTPAYKWLQQNAYKFGFILRNPEDKQSITQSAYEPWHYRYVGVDNATVMQQKGLCLEEYLDTLEQARADALAQAAKQEDENSENSTAQSESE